MTFVRNHSLTVISALILAIMAFAAISVVMVQSDVALGDLVSEKLLGRAGTADSSLLLGRTGTNTELSVLGFAPIVSTQSAVSVSGTSATLSGRITNMNGMPSARYYFEWGYNSGALTNTTTPVTISATGDYSTTITGITGGGIVYYRFVTDADGTAYGTISHFPASAGAGSFLLKSLLRVILAASILIMVVMFARSGGGGFLALLFAVIIGLIAFFIVDAFIISML